MLTRLPGKSRLSSTDAATLIKTRFGGPLVLEQATASMLPQILSQFGISGGAVYDGMVALAAVQENCVLATRDARAKLTYDAVGVRVEIVQ